MTNLSATLQTPRGRKELIRFAKFGVVGAVGAIVDFGMLSFLIFVVGMSSPAGKIIANIISTSMAIISNFTWNRLWTFPESRQRKKRVQLVQFTLVNMIGLVLNTAIFTLADNFVYANFVSHDISVLLAKATAIGIVLFWNFGANRLWTYKGL